MMQIAGHEPDIILVTEVIPKAQTLPLTSAVFSIPSYNMYANFEPSQPNLGGSGCRGVCIFVSDRLHTTEVLLCANTTMEHLWVSMNLLSGDKLLIGCIYLSPSGNRQCSMTELQETLKLVSIQKASHVLIAGDFNAPQVDWADMYSDAPPGHYSHDLIRCVQDNFLTQHVKKPTRYRHGQVPSTLDLILTNEEGMVQDLQYLPAWPWPQ